MAPGSILIISISITLLLLCFFSLPFTFHFASLYQKYQKYYLSSLSDLTPVSDREGIVSGGICLHEHLWGRSPFSVRRGAELARRADRDDAHEGFTQLRATR